MKSNIILILILFGLGFAASAQDIPVNLQNIDPMKIQSIIQSYSGQLQSMGITQDQAGQILLKNQDKKLTDTIKTDVNKSSVSQDAITHHPTKFDSTKLLTSDSTKNLNSDHRRFGMSLFRNQDYRVYKLNSDLVAPENYIVGTGDRLNISIWGFSNYSNSFIVDETGSIFPSTIGKIYLRGLTLRDARALIKSRFSDSYNFSNNDIEVTLSGSRNITVNIVGDITMPGSYSLPAYNTMFNALVAAGGPTINGSFRNIYVKRNGATVYTFDVYDFLLNPDSKNNYYLQDNDYIFISAVSRTIEIQGEVIRPFEFELSAGENLIKALAFAGGYKPNANKQHLILKRITPQGFIYLDIPADSLSRKNQDYTLQAGDIIIVKSIPSQNTISITVKGAISFTGEQSFAPNDKIADLIKRNPLLDETYLDKAFLTRRQSDYTLINIPFSLNAILADPNSSDNQTLINGDVIHFLSKKDFIDALNVTINGAVRNPGTVEYATNMTLSQLIHIAGGLTPNADVQRIEISRIYDGENNVAPIPVIVKTIQLSNSKLSSTDANYLLKPFDVVAIRSVSSFSEVLNVTVKGEVLFPGTYSLLDKNERISSLINRAGGLTGFAYAENTLLFRNESERGIVALRLDKILKKPGSRFDVILKKGDLIDVKSKSNVVTITGEVMYTLSDSSNYVNVPFEYGKRARYYIKKYGLGFNSYSKRKATYVINPGNNTRTCRNILFVRSYPKVKQDAIIVVPPIPGKEQRALAERTPVDWNRTIESITLKVTAIATLLVILSRVQL